VINSLLALLKLLLAVQQLLAQQQLIHALILQEIIYIAHISNLFSLRYFIIQLM
jgi:hypothetical protein